jgi:hypothetical protein
MRRALATRIINAIPHQATAHAVLMTGLLHQLFNDPVVRDEHLANALARVQQWMSAGQAGPAMVFAAHYADQPAVNDRWLAWIAQQWITLASPERHLVLRAAGRAELLPPHAAAQHQTPALLDHLIDPAAKATWEPAPRLWAALNEDQRAQLLALPSEDVARNWPGKPPKCWGTQSNRCAHKQGPSPRRSPQNTTPPANRRRGMLPPRRQPESAAEPHSATSRRCREYRGPSA